MKTSYKLFIILFALFCCFSTSFAEDINIYNDSGVIEVTPNDEHFYTDMLWTVHLTTCRKATINYEINTNYCSNLTIWGEDNNGNTIFSRTFEGGTSNSGGMESDSEVCLIKVQYFTDNCEPAGSIIRVEYSTGGAPQIFDNDVFFNSKTVFTSDNISYFGGMTGGRIQGTSTGSLSIGSNPSGTNKTIYLNSSSDGNVILGTGGGNVGIGIASPTYKLHVAGNSYVSGNNYINGNVGIGTTSPSQKLHVVGNSYVSGNSYTNGNLGIGTTSPTTKLHVVGNSYTSGNVGIGTTTMAQKFNVTGKSYFSDNVGIGITNPTTKLHVAGAACFTDSVVIGNQSSTSKNLMLDVNGAIRAHEIRVCLEQGCDFVFEPNYNLMPLEELSHFVSQNKHLPDVAPAKVMETNGINISEMNFLLLKKVEELTLYILTQNEETKELKENYKALNEKYEILSAQIDKKQVLQP